METLAMGFAPTCPVLFGSRSFRALGLTRVEVTRKKMSSRNTMSVILDIENDASAFSVLFSAIPLCAYDSEGSLSRSMNLIVALSIE